MHRNKNGPSESISPNCIFFSKELPLVIVAHFPLQVQLNYLGKLGVSTDSYTPQQCSVCSPEKIVFLLVELSTDISFFMNLRFAIIAHFTYQRISKNMEKKPLQWHFVRSCDRLNATFLNPEDCQALSQSGKMLYFCC